jgi:alpha-beta hydrolase superfamily lysophospholipase
MAVIGEEFGLIGVLTVIGLFMWMVRRIMHIGRQSIALDRLFAGLRRVGTPLLILIPADDRLVDNSAPRRAHMLLPGAALVAIPGAGHELLREASDTRAQVLARALAFLMQAP